VLTDEPGVSVGSDNAQGGYDVTRHLTSLGRRRLAFLGHATTHYPEFFDRYRGYERALMEERLATDSALQVDAITTEEEAGIDVPKQVSVVGFDDIPAASLTNPPLTTVMQDTRRAGELLVETLLRQIAGDPASNNVIPTKLVVRKSA
jgi:DNA-binding LacI/PurR family transcriptional regulator